MDKNQKSSPKTVFATLALLLASFAISMCIAFFPARLHSASALYVTGFNNTTWVFTTPNKLKTSAGLSNFEAVVNFRDGNSVQYCGIKLAATALSYMDAQTGDWTRAAQRSAAGAMFTSTEMRTITFTSEPTSGGSSLSYFLSECATCSMSRVRGTTWRIGNYNGNYISGVTDTEADANGLRTIAVDFVDGSGQEHHSIGWRINEYNNGVIVEYDGLTAISGLQMGSGGGIDRIGLMTITTTGLSANIMAANENARNITFTSDAGDDTADLITWLGLNATLTNVAEVKDPGAITLSASSGAQAVGQTSKSFTYTGATGTVTGTATNSATVTVTPDGTSGTVTIGNIGSLAVGSTVTVTLTVAESANNDSTTATYTLTIGPVLAGGQGVVNETTSWKYLMRTNLNVTLSEAQHIVVDQSTLVSTLGTLNTDYCSVGTGVWGAYDSSDYTITFYTNGVNSKIFLPADSRDIYGPDTLLDIEISKFDTSNVTNMSRMFYYCTSLLSLDLSGFDTSKATDMSYMFSCCNALESLDLSGFDTSNVTNMCNMFQNCDSLTSLDLSGFDTSKVTDMSFMFSVCAELTSLDLRGFDTRNVTDMRSMFRQCGSLTSLDLSNFDASSLVDMNWMFFLCRSLESLDLRNFNTSSVTNMAHILQDCSALTRLNISSFNFGSVTESYNADIFYYCTSLMEIVVPASHAATYLPTLPSGTGPWYVQNGSSNTQYWGGDPLPLLSTAQDKVAIAQSIAVTFDKNGGTGTTNRTYAVYGAQYNHPLTTLPKNPTKSGYMFVGWCLTEENNNGTGCAISPTKVVTPTADFTLYAQWEELLPPELSASWQSSVATNLGVTISQVQYIVVDHTTLISNLSVDYTSVGTCVWASYDSGSKTIRIYTNGVRRKILLGTEAYGAQMFAHMDSLISINLRKFDTSNLTSMMQMFGWDYALTSLDLSGFDTSNVTTMEEMFVGCTSLTSLDLSGFDTSSVMNVYNMFSGCSALTRLNISSFDFGSVTSSANGNMLNGCTTLREIVVPASHTATYLPTLPNGPWYVQNGSSSTSYASGANLPLLSTAQDEVTIARGYTVTFDKNGGTGTTNNTVVVYGGQYNHPATVLPGNPTKDGHTFRGWCLTEENDNGTGDVITPTTVVTPTADFTLYAKWGSLKNAGAITLSARTGAQAVGQTSKSFTYTGATGTVTGTATNGATVTVTPDGTSGTVTIGNIGSLAVGATVTVTLTVAETANNDSTTTTYTLTIGPVLAGGQGSEDGDRTSWNYLMRTNLGVMGIEVQHIVVDQSTLVSTLGTLNTDYCLVGTGVWGAYDLLDRTITFYTNGVDSKIFLPADSSFMFSYYYDMSPPHFGLGSLLDIEISKFDTGNVTDMWGMFYECGSLTSLDLSSFNTSNVTNMYYMFGYCYSLTSLDLSSFNTNNVTDMSEMFEGCSELTSLNVSSFDTGSVEYMGYMFSYCGSLTSLNVSSFDTSNVTDISGMFSGCSSLTSLNLSGFDTGSVEYMGWMFGDCSSLTSLNLSSFNTSNVTYMNGMFSGCSSLTSLNLSGFNTSNVTEMNSMFRGCSALTSLNLSVFNTSNVTSMDSMFDGCSSLTSLNLSSFNTSNVTNMYAMFYSCSALTSLNLSGFITSNVTDMFCMFSGCSSLTSLNLSSFNTSNVENMASMFRSCSALTSLDLSGFNTGNVTNMESMFRGCSALISVNLSSFYTSKVTSMQYMFDNCSSLTSLNLSNFNTSNVKDMKYMFYLCSALTSLNLSSFNTSNVTRMDYMFSNCSSLTHLDISSFNFGSTTSSGRNYMLNSCTALREIVVPASHTATYFPTLSSGPWYVQNGSSSTSYASGANLPLLSTAQNDVTIARGYTVTFDKNGGSGTTDATVAVYGGRYNHPATVLPSNPTRSGYTFLGWCLTETDDNGTGDVITPTTVVTPTANFTLYAKWEEILKDPGAITLSASSGAQAVGQTSKSFTYTGATGTVTGTATNGATVTVTPDGTSGTVTIGNIGSLAVGSTVTVTLTVAESANNASTTATYTLTIGPVLAGGQYLGISDTTSWNYLMRTNLNVPMRTQVQRIVVDQSTLVSTLDTLNTDYCSVGTGVWGAYDSSDYTITFYTNGVNSKIFLPADSSYMFSHNRGTYSLVALLYIEISEFDTSNVTSMRGMFSGCGALTSLDLSSFDTSNVTSMASMFSSCSALASINLSSFNTSNVENMSEMFGGCTSLTSLDLSGFNTSNVTSMSHMFIMCSSLTSLDLSNFNTSNVTDMSRMFFNCQSLTSLDLHNFSYGMLEGWEQMDGMLALCQSLTRLDISSLDFSVFSDGFFGDDLGVSSCEDLIEIVTPLSVELSAEDVENLPYLPDNGPWYVQNGSSSTSYASGAALPLLSTAQNKVTIARGYTVTFDKNGGTGTTNNTVAVYGGRFNHPATVLPSNPTKSGYMFVGWCLTETNDNGTGDVITPTTVVTPTADFTLYAKWEQLPTLAGGQGSEDGDTTSWNYLMRTNLGVTMIEVKHIVVDQTTLVSTLGTLNTDYCLVGTNVWGAYDASKKEITFYTNGVNSKIFLPADSSNMFSYNYEEPPVFGLRALLDIEISKFDTSNVTNMDGMFYDCLSLTSLSVSGFDTSNVTSMYGMFEACNALTSLDLSSFDTGNVEEMGYMFSACSALTSLNLSSFNTSNVTSMGQMFGSCESLTSLNLSSFNTSNVVNMNGMFGACSALTTLNLSSFNTSNVTNMSYMFNSCSSLTSLDLSSFNTSNVTGMNSMFFNCSSLVEIWTPSAVNGGGYVADLPGTFYDVSRTANTYTTLPGGNLHLRKQGIPFLAGGQASGGSDTTSWNYLMRTKLSVTMRQVQHIVVDQSTLVSTLGTLNTNYCSVGTNVWGAYNTSTKTITFYTNGVNSKIFLPADSSFMFSHSLNDVLSALIDVEFSKFDTSNVTNMGYMFYYCRGLTSLDLSSFNTSSVTNMRNMFIGCSGLTSLNLSSFSTSNVTNMRGMFQSCYSLTSLDLSSFNTSNVTDMTGMFYGCIALTSLNLSSFNTSNVTNMSNMFNECRSLTSLDLSSFDTSNVTSISNMFQRCTTLAEIWTPKAMNTEHPDLVTVYYDYDNPSNLYTTLQSSQMHLIALPTLAGEKTHDDVPIFSWNCLMGTNLGATITEVEHIVVDQSTLVSTLGTLNTNYCLVGTNVWGAYNTSTKTITFYTNGVNSKIFLPADSSWMFSAYDGYVMIDGLLDIEISKFDTSYVMDMFEMFAGCSSLTSLDLSSFNTSNVTSMESLFESCSSLASLNLSSFDTSNVTNMNGMFYYCSSLTSLNLSSFNTSNVTDMGLMFEGCSALTSLNLSSFNTGSVEWMSYMFEGCSALASLNLSNFNTSNVTSMSHMFYNCSSLTSLDLSNFNTSNVTNMEGMFENCSALTRLDISSFNFGSIDDNDGGVSNFVGGCTALREIVTPVDHVIGDSSPVLSSGPWYVQNGSSSTSYASGANLPLLSTAQNAVTIARGYTVTFDKNGGTGTTNNTVAVYGGQFNHPATVLPSNPTRSGYTFLGWCLTEEDNNGTGDVITPTTVVTPTANFTLYAKWEQLPTLAGGQASGDSDTTSWNYLMRTNLSVTVTMSEVQHIVVDQSTLVSTLGTLNTNYCSVGTNVWGAYNTSTKTITFYTNGVNSKIFLPANSSYMFSHNNYDYILSALLDIEISKFDTSNVTNMSSMFSVCEALTSLNLSNFNTSNVTNMEGMFNGCEALTSVNLSNFNTSNVTDMSYMFNSCSALTSLDLSGFDTGSVFNVTQMFCGCSSLTSLNLSSFNTSVRRMTGMFYGCSALTSLDLSNFNTSNTTEFMYMFGNCSSLVRLDISSFNFGSVTFGDNASGILSGCTALREIVVPASHTATYLPTLSSGPWYVQNGSSSTSYASGANLPLLSTAQNTVTIARGYTVTFDKNGGTGTTNSTVAVYGGQFNHPITTLPSNPTKEGYNFLGWCLTEEDDNGTGDVITPTTVVAPTANFTLYAKWEEILKDPGTITLSASSGTQTYGRLMSGFYFSGASGTVTGTATNGATVTIMQQGADGSVDIENISSLNAGTTVTVTLTVAETDDYFSTTATYTLTITQAAGSISYSPTTLTKVYGEDPFTKTLTNTGDGTVTYASSDTNVATVAANGQVTIVKAGSATITATVADGTNYTYASTTASYTLTVNKAAGNISYETTSVTKKYGDGAFTNALTKSGDGTVTYASSNTNVATVAANGQVTIVKAGSATITATVTDGTNFTYESTTAQYTLTVNKANGNISYATTSVEKSYGEAAFTNALTKTGDGTVTYASSNENVATVNGSGLVTIKGAGSATITATVTDGTNFTYESTTAQYTLTVNKANGNISYATTSVEKSYGEAAFTNALTKTGDGTVTYASSNENVATVNGSGLVTIKGAGSATITATVTDGTNFTYESTTASYTLTVNKANGNISYATTSVEKSYGEAAFTNALTNTGDGTVTYASSDTNVATVAANGQVTIVKAGSATITATVADGTNFTYASTTAQYTLTVNKASGSISYATTSVTKSYGSANFTNALTKTGDGTVTYSSSKTNVATVDEYGEVTIVGSGSATITATVADGTNFTYEVKTATYDLYIVSAVEKPTVNTNVYTYDGSAHAITFVDEIDSEKISITGNSATSAGQHAVLVQLVDPANFQWSDGTTTAYNLTLTINKASVAKLVANTHTFDYDGQSHSMTFTANYDSNIISVTGNSATSAGQHAVLVSLIDPVNYQWSDGTIAPYNLTLTISPSYRLVATLRYDNTCEDDATGGVNIQRVDVNSNNIGEPTGHIFNNCDAANGLTQSVNFVRLVDGYYYVTIWASTNHLATIDGLLYNTTTSEMTINICITKNNYGSFYGNSNVASHGGNVTIANLGAKRLDASNDLANISLLGSNSENQVISGLVSAMSFSNGNAEFTKNIKSGYVVLDSNGNIVEDGLPGYSQYIAGIGSAISSGTGTQSGGNNSGSQSGEGGNMQGGNENISNGDGITADTTSQTSTTKEMQPIVIVLLAILMTLAVGTGIAYAFVKKKDK